MTIIFHSPIKVQRLQTRARMCHERVTHIHAIRQSRPPARPHKHAARQRREHAFFLRRTHSIFHSRRRRRRVGISSVRFCVFMVVRVRASSTIASPLAQIHTFVGECALGGIR